MSPLALLLSLLLCAASEARAKTMSRDFLFCERRVNCEAAPSLSAPRNALLINFQDGDFTGSFSWIKSEKEAVIRGVNDLLRHYGFPVTAREIDESTYAALRGHPDADVILKYRANSFLAVVGQTGVQSNQGGTHIVGVERIGNQIMIFGPTRHPGFTVQDSDIELIEIRPIRELGEDAIAAPRKRAMLVGMIVHEFVHAAHHRAMGTVVSGPPAAAMAPSCVVPYEKASEATTKFLRALQFSRSSGHMAEGLMVAGQDHQGNMNDVYGGGKYSMKACLSDKRIPLSLIDNLAALANHAGLCGPNDEDGPGHPASDYFRLPDFNKKFIASYLAKMEAAQCYGGCYYVLLDTQTAMKRAGYDMNRYLTLENQVPIGRPQGRIPEALPHNPRYEAWWVEANRQCSARDRRTAAR